MSPRKPRLGLQEPRTLLFWRDALSEVLVSAFLLIFLTFSQLHFLPDWTPTPTHVGLMMGFVVFVLIEAFGHISGGHMNTGVTFIFWARGDLSVIKALTYVVAQCGGAALGSGLVYGLTPSGYRHMFSPFQPAPQLGPYRGMAIEAILSTFYYFVILGVTDPDRGLQCTVPGFPIGAVISIDIMAAMSYTGASMNPLIALGPAIITGNFKHHWVYWAGPMLGGVFAVALYFGLTAVKAPSYSPAEHASSISSGSAGTGEHLVLRPDNNNTLKQRNTAFPHAKTEPETGSV